MSKHGRKGTFMKKIRDFIYNFSDIFTTLLIVAIAGGIVFWRVQVIMGYSKLTSANNPETVIDIDFSDVDLTPIDKPDYNENGEEVKPDDTVDETPAVIVIDENYRSTKPVAVAINWGDSYEKAIRYVSSAYGFSDDDYYTFFSLLWNKGIEMDAATVIQVGTFTIPEGSSFEDMINIITGKQ